MSTAVTVVKLGGDALATPERVAAEARRFARRVFPAPAVAVVSARRGITDRLLGLTAEVRRALDSGESHGPHREPAGGGGAEADRAVACGELVAASLLALALNDLGIPAVSLDAREAGIYGRGGHAGGRLRRVAPTKLERLLGQGLLPVVAGFQVWQGGRLATLARGGTDLTAVALGVALRATRTVLVKESAGLHTADPRLVPEARLISEATHGFVADLSAAGARVLQHQAAVLAERRRLELEFWGLSDDTPATRIRSGTAGADLRAVATEQVSPECTRVTAVAGTPGVVTHHADGLRAALVSAGIRVLEVQPAANGVAFLVSPDEGEAATRVLHGDFVENAVRRRARRAS